jgi:hypothetical protein
MRRSPQVQGCGGEAVLKSSGKMDAEQGTVADWLEQRKQRLVWLLPSTDGSGFRANGSSGILRGPRMAPSSSGGLSCRPDSDVVVQRRGDFGFSHGRPPVLLSPSFSFSPSPPLFLRWTGRNPQGRRRILGDEAGTNICKAVLGFEGASGRCRCGTGGRRGSIRRANAIGDGAHGWRRHGGRPAPTTCARDKAEEGEKVGERRG